MDGTRISISHHEMLFLLGHLISIYDSVSDVNKIAYFSLTSHFKLMNMICMLNILKKHSILALLGPVVAHRIFLGAFRL